METTARTTKTEAILALGMAATPQRAVRTGSLRERSSQYPPIMKKSVVAMHMVRSISRGGRAFP